MDDLQRDFETLPENRGPTDGRLAEANALFTQLLDAETDLQDLFLTPNAPFDPERRARVFLALRKWSAMAAKGLRLDCSKELLANVKQAKDMLTSDEEFFFTDDACRKIRQVAVETLAKGS